MGAPSTEDVLKLRGIAQQYFISRALYAAAELDIADRLADGAKSAEELAAGAAHAPSLYRVLRVLAASGIFVEDDAHRFANTPLSDLLRTDAPGSLRDFVLLFGDETSWRAWEGILHAVRTGESPFEHVYGEKFFDYVQRHPDKSAMFDRAMASASATTNAAVVEACDFSGLVTLVDVAGGTGSALCSVLVATPGLRGIVFDLPHVQERATQFVARQGLSDRCEFVAGNFFESVPAGAGAYFMKHILHDWGDVDCLRILASCRKAMPGDSRLLICERIVPEGNVASSAKLIDLHMMMVNHGGRERTTTEYHELLSAGGFSIRRIVPTSTPWSVIEATPA